MDDEELKRMKAETDAKRVALTSKAATAREQAALLQGQIEKGYHDIGRWLKEAQKLEEEAQQCEVEIARLPKKPGYGIRIDLSRAERGDRVQIVKAVNAVCLKTWCYESGDAEFFCRGETEILPMLLKQKLLAKAVIWIRDADLERLKLMADEFGSDIKSILGADNSNEGDNP